MRARYMIPEVNPNRFEMSFRLRGNLHRDFIFPNNSKTLLHMCKWYPLIIANLINAKKGYQWKFLIDASLINVKQMLLF